MEKLKENLIFVLIIVLTFVQIIIAYQKSLSEFSFYPYWKVNLRKNILTIYQSELYFGEFFNLKNLGFFRKFKKENNSLIISSNLLKLCNHCFLIDEKNKIIFTHRSPKEDIVVKKKLIAKGYQVNPKTNLEISPKNNNFFLFDATFDKKLHLLFTSPVNLQVNNEVIKISTNSTVNQLFIKLDFNE